MMFDDDWCEDYDDDDDDEFVELNDHNYSPSQPWNAPGMSVKDFIR